MYFDLVVCKFGSDRTSYLFRAPAWSHLEKGQKVIVETVNGKKHADVVATLTTKEDTDEYRALVAATNATMPLQRVFSRILEYVLDYAEETE